MNNPSSSSTTSSSFFPLFTAATHILRLKTESILDFKSVSVNIIVEQTEVSKDGVLNSPTRTIFTRSSLPISTDRVPGFTAYSDRTWLPALKDTKLRADYSSSNNNNNNSSAAPSWEVSMLHGCEGTMLVKETRSAEEREQHLRIGRNNSGGDEDDDGFFTLGGLPVTFRAQIIGHRDVRFNNNSTNQQRFNTYNNNSNSNNNQTEIIAESGSQEISAARIIFVRKVMGLLLHTPIGDVAVVISVAREDTNGCQTRVEQFLYRYSSLANNNNNHNNSSSSSSSAITTVAHNLINAANGDEIMVFCQLRKKFNLTDFEGRLQRYMKLYSLDSPDDYEISDNQVVSALLREWAPTEELLFVALATIFGPEQDILSSWIRFRALHSVIPTTSTTKTTHEMKSLNKRWKKELKQLLSASSSSSSSPEKILQGPIQQFFSRCCEEVSDVLEYDTDYQQQLKEERQKQNTNKSSSSSSSSSTTFREPPPFLYLFDHDVRQMLHIDSFGGFSQSAVPGDVLGGDDDNNNNHESARMNNNDDDNFTSSSKLFEKRIRRNNNNNSSTSLVDVVTEGTQTKKDIGESMASQCDFFKKPETNSASTMAVEFKLTQDEMVGTNDHIYQRSCEIQTEEEEVKPTVDAEVDATETISTSTREVQTVKIQDTPKRSMKVSTVDHLPKVGFEEEILARDGHLRRELEKTMNEHIAKRRETELELAQSNEVAETARSRLSHEVEVRQGLEKDLDATKKELSEASMSLQKMSLQQKFLDSERKDIISQREEMRKKMDETEETIKELEEGVEEKQRAVFDKQQELDKLTSDLEEKESQCQSLNRQLEIYAQDAKASREMSEKHFARMKELEDELLQEKTTRAEYQAAIESNQKSDLLMGMNSSESLLEKLQRLEQEKEDLLRERDFYMTSSLTPSNKNKNNNINDSTAQVSPSPHHHQKRFKIVKAIEKRIDPETGAEYEVEIEVEQEITLEEENADPSFQEKVSQARDRLKAYREGRNKLRRPPTAYLDIDHAPPPDPGVPPLLNRPRLPSGRAPLLLVNDQSGLGYLVGSKEERHKYFSAGKSAAAAGSSAQDWLTASEDSPHSQQVFYSQNPDLAVSRDKDQDVYDYNNNNNNNTGGGAFAGVASGRSQLLSPTAPSPLPRPGSYQQHQRGASPTKTATTAAPPRLLIDEGWTKFRRGLVDAARSCWEQAARGLTLTTSEMKEPVHIGSKYEAEGILAEMIFHDTGKAAENYSAAMKYWPTPSVVLRLAGLHDREANGDGDVAVELYRMAARMGSEAAKVRLAELMVK